MDPILISFGIFLLAVIFIGSVYFFIWEMPEREKRRRIKDRLESISEAGRRAPSPELDLIKSELLSDVPAINKILLQFSHTNRLKSLIEQADIKIKVGTFVLISIMLFGFGTLAAQQFLRILPVSILVGVFFSC